MLRYHQYLYTYTACVFVCSLFLFIVGIYLFPCYVIFFIFVCYVICFDRFLASVSVLLER